MMKKIPFEATLAANSYFKTESEGKDYQFIILESLTKEIPYGWVFHANTDRYLKSKDPEWKLHVCVIIQKETYSSHVVGTPYPLQYYIDRFERKFEE